MTRKEVLVLRVIELLSQKGPLSRTQIAEYLKVSKATVTHVTRLLIENHLATEVNEFSNDQAILSSAMGRKAVPLELNPNAGWLIGIDLSGSRIIGVVVNMAMEQHALLEFEHLSLLSDTVPLDTITGVVDGVMTMLGASRHMIKGVGISIRALNYEVTACASANLMDVEGNAKLVCALQSHYGLPVFIVHNIQALLISEMIGRKDSGPTILVHVGEGIGGAIWLDHKPIEGAHHAAGEWGHITADPNGIPCACGKRGCIEAMYAIPQLVARAHSQNTDIQSWPDFVRHAGSDMVKTILAEFASVSAQALSGAVILTDPDQVIINGPICDVSEYFVPIFTQHLQQYLIPKTAQAISVIPSTTGIDAGARGAAYLLIGPALSRIARNIAVV